MYRERHSKTRLVSSWCPLDLMFTDLWHLGSQALASTEAGELLRTKRITGRVQLNMEGIRAQSTGQCPWSEMTADRQQPHNAVRPGPEVVQHWRPLDRWREPREAGLLHTTGPPRGLAEAGAAGSRQTCYTTATNTCQNQN